MGLLEAQVEHGQLAGHVPSAQSGHYSEDHQSREDWGEHAELLHPQPIKKLATVVELVNRELTIAAAQVERRRAFSPKCSPSGHT
jgi:hypothetical protein